MAKTKTTETIEKERLKLWNDYQTYLKVEKSDELKEYLALKEKVESKPFLENKKEIESLRYKGSPAEKQFKTYQKILRNRKLKRYFECLNSVELARFKSIEESGQLEQLSELEKFVKSGKYKKELVTFKKRKKADKENQEVWENTEHFLKFKAYNELSKSSDITFFKTYKKSRIYKNYLNIKGSALLTQFENLKNEIESDNFKERKAYLEDSKRYEKSEDYKTLSRFNDLDLNENIKIYNCYNDTDSFKFFRDWTPTFEENFSSLNTERWSFIAPYAQKGPGKNFSIENQLHYANGSDNVNVENSIFTIETKKEKIEGLFWDQQFGFMPKEFNYASGLAHTIGSFEQEYGYFEFKLKASKLKGVFSSVSLVNESEDVCIRLFSANGGVAQGGIIRTDHKNKIIDPVKLPFQRKGYAIIGLKWTREKLEWSVNERILGSITNGIPHTKMGIRIETEVLKDSSNLPHRLDIDWIKCYSAAN